MNLTNDEAQYFINIAKRLEYYILKIPMGGSKKNIQHIPPMININLMPVCT